MSKLPDLEDGLDRLTLSDAFKPVVPAPFGSLIDPDQEETKCEGPMPAATFPALLRGDPLELCAELEQLIELLDLKSNKFIFYCRVRVEGSLEEATKDNSTKTGLRGTFSRKSKVEEAKDPEEEVFLLLATETFHLIPLDMNEYRARTFSYLEIEKVTPEESINGVMIQFYCTAKQLDKSEFILDLYYSDEQERFQSEVVFKRQR